jgi:hypothetical protein
MTVFAYPSADLEVKFESDNGEQQRRDFSRIYLGCDCYALREVFAIWKAVHHKIPARPGYRKILVCIVVDTITLLLRKLVQHRPVPGLDVLQ